MKQWPLHNYHLCNKQQFGFYRGGQQLGDALGGALGGQDPQLQMIGLQQQILRRT
jgi:hypothetical protein